jgi:hypothetical protein
VYRGSRTDAYCVVSLTLARSALAQPAAAPEAPPAVQAAPPESIASSGAGVGFALRASTLGLGIDGAFRLHRRLNARIGINRYTYSREFEDADSDITYTGTLALQSVAAYLDWFPFGGGFHVSPGITIKNGNELRFDATVPAGETISVDDEDYLSTASRPIHASGVVSVAATRPALLIGWGNLVPRSRRVSVPIELGVVFQGRPAGRLAFTGTACAENGRNCRDMATDPAIQRHVQNEEASLNDDLGLSALRFYPVISLGVGFRF